MERNYQFKGCWIQHSQHDYGTDDQDYYAAHPHTLLKKIFYVDNILDCYLYVGVLGYYIGYLNGHRIGNYELNSDWTNYQKCVYYDVYDVSSLLVKGENEIVFELGNGMYNPSPLKLFGKYNLREKLHEVGEPCLICDFVHHGEVILSSDQSWQVGKGNLLFNNLYLGETVDFTLKDNHWQPVITSWRKYHMQLSEIPKIKKKQSVYPRDIQPYKDGWLIDFQEMISGYLHLDIIACHKQQIIIQYSEHYVDELDFTTSLAGSVGEWMGNSQISGGLGAPITAIQTDRIICDEGMNSFENRFTYHSFRYAYITGCELKDIKDIYAIYVHTDLKQIGIVKTDHLFFNHLYDVAIRTKLNNVHSIFEDCARERLGYGGDMVALATSNLYTFDLETFYKKIIRDFRYDQTDSGGIPETAPYMGIQSNGTGHGEGPLLWQLVYPYLTYKHYQYYGDISLIQEEYPYLKKQINYLMNYPIEQLAECCLGDHGSVLIAGQFRKPTPDKLLLGYCTILLLLKYFIYISQILKEEVYQYQELYQEIKKQTILKFMNDDGTFGEATQSSYAFAIALELDEPHRLCQKFVNQIESDKYVFNSGIFGMALTYEILSQYGYNEVIEKWLLQDSQVSFQHMLSTGNQSLIELFVGEHMSMNHAMFASYQQWYYQGLAGIQITDNAVAFNKIILKPYFSRKLNHVECQIKTKQGIISSSWKRKNNFIYWDLIIPDTVDYDIKVPYHFIEHQCHGENIRIVFQENKK